ncbi:LGFP repeat-containing protein, partial [Modestobacter lacusdianchii]
MTRAIVRLATVVALIASVLLLPTAGSTPTAPAQAADLGYFDPANIISDAIFFDALATDPGTVQTFLNTKGANCVAGEMPCLKDYSQTTATQAGDAYCATYPGGTNESAATILVKIGQACGINPRVLLVLLQKEQGLITGTKPTTTKYTKATGFACPDTAACNPAFSGFVSQVYYAARQFQRYAAGVAGSYRAGKNNTVYYHPDLARCGSSQVYIQNKATAGLYSYTPYQPNAAALGAGYGTGDSCSSYGNRNFWNYFTDWFGSTQSAGAGAIYLKYAEMGGAAGSLGAVTSGYICGLRDGGCLQSYQRGSIYWSPATGAHSMTGELQAAWSVRGLENGALGYPVSEPACGLVGGGCFQEFAGGSLYWTAATGAHFTRGSIRALWGAVGWE